MNNNDDFYKKFNIETQKSSNFKSNIFIPFLSGVLGSALVMGLAFGVPNIKEKLVSYNSAEITTSTNSTDNHTANNGVVNSVSLNNYSDTSVYAANKVLPSIVGITVDYTVTSNFMQGMSQVSQAEGSGIIISNDGYILTNNHIINSSDSSIYYEVSEANKVCVYLYNDETPYEAKIIGTDEQTDLAVIKIEKDNFASLKPTPIPLSELEKTIPKAKDAQTPGEATLSIVLWVDETKSDQTKQDSGKIFAGGIIVNTDGANGHGITGVFSAGGVEKE